MCILPINCHNERAPLLFNYFYDIMLHCLKTNKLPGDRKLKIWSYGDSNHYLLMIFWLQALDMRIHSHKCRISHWTLCNRELCYLLSNGNTHHFYCHEKLQLNITRYTFSKNVDVNIDDNIRCKYKLNQQHNNHMLLLHKIL